MYISALHCQSSVSCARALHGDGDGDGNLPEWIELLREYCSVGIFCYTKSAGHVWKPCNHTVFRRINTYPISSCIVWPTALSSDTAATGCRRSVISSWSQVL